MPHLHILQSLWNTAEDQINSQIYSPNNLSCLYWTDSMTSNNTTYLHVDLFPFNRFQLKDIQLLHPYPHSRHTSALWTVMYNAFMFWAIWYNSVVQNSVVAEMTALLQYNCNIVQFWGVLCICLVHLCDRLLQNITIPAEAVIKWVLEAVDCLLIIESLKEDSLMEDEAQSFRGIGDRKRRQGNLSARVILRKHTASTRICLHCLHMFTSVEWQWPTM